MADYTFGGRVQWDIEPQSMATDLKAEALERSISETVTDIPQDQKPLLSEFCVFLSCTHAVHASETAKGALKALVSMIAQHEQAAPEVLWRFRLALPYAVLNAWRAAFKDAQELFETDPAQLPTEALTEAQKAEAATPGSPLA